MEKRAEIQMQGRSLKQQLLKVAAENGYNLSVARHNAYANAAGEVPKTYKNAEFLELVRKIDSLIGLALD